MANVTVAGASYEDVPAVDLPATGGGTVRFTDVSDTTASASEVASGFYFYNAQGVKTAGTGTGGGGIIVTETPDVHGGTIISIDSGSVETLQAKSTTPTEQTQNIEPDDGYDGLSQVIVNPIPSQYIIPSGTKNISTNGVHDVTSFANASVNVPAYTLLASDEMTGSYSGTSAKSLGIVRVDSTELWTKTHMIYVHIYDKAGPRDGYFYSSDNWFFFPTADPTQTSVQGSTFARIITMKTSSGYNTYSGGYGVYAYQLVYSDSTDNYMRIYYRYSSAYSGTINGTYKVEIYALEWPGGVSPFVSAS